MLRRWRGDERRAWASGPLRNGRQRRWDREQSAPMNQAAAPGEEVLAHIAGGAMLYDAACLDHPDPRGVRAGVLAGARGACRQRRGGRGTVAFVTTAAGAALGAAALSPRRLHGPPRRRPVFLDRRAAHALVSRVPPAAAVAAWDLPVPQPVAARYARTAAGLSCRPHHGGVADATDTGAGVAGRSVVDDGLGRDRPRASARLHARGVQHADLNAHNILLARAGDVYVLDFDRGRIRARGAWERVVLARLHRSLAKVTAGLPAGSLRRRAVAGAAARRWATEAAPLALRLPPARLPAGAAS